MLVTIDLNFYGSDNRSDYAIVGLFIFLIAAVDVQFVPNSDFLPFGTKFDFGRPEETLILYQIDIFDTFGTN